MDRIPKCAMDKNIQIKPIQNTAEIAANIVENPPKGLSMSARKLSELWLKKPGTKK